MAGEIITLSVGFDEQDFVRDTERQISELFETWRKRFPSKSVAELMAMMTYQYASYYMAVSKRHAEALDMLAECDGRLEKILLGRVAEADGA